jgi:hypothetical protein
VIIKGNRVRANRHPALLLNHLAWGPDNEAIEVIRGAEEQVQSAFEDARAWRKAYAVRHFIIAPREPIDRSQALTVLSMLGHEFGFDPMAATVFEHFKPRVADAGSSVHWHALVPEVDPATGRVLDCRHSYPRHEKIARHAEVLFGHASTPGAHQAAVLARLQSDGDKELVRSLQEVGMNERSPRPKEAFSSAAHQMAKRVGIDLPAIRATVRTAWSTTNDKKGFVAALAAAGLQIEPGDKPRTWVIETTDPRHFAGAAHRLAGVRKVDMAKRMEENEDGNRSNDKRRTRNLPRGPVQPRDGGEAVAPAQLNPERSRGGLRGRRRQGSGTSRSYFENSGSIGAQPSAIARGTDGDTTQSVTASTPDIGRDGGQWLVSCLSRQRISLIKLLDLTSAKSGAPAEIGFNQDIAQREASASAAVLASDAPDSTPEINEASAALNAAEDAPRSMKARASSLQMMLEGQQANLPGFFTRIFRPRRQREYIAEYNRLHAAHRAVTLDVFRAEVRAKAAKIQFEKQKQGWKDYLRATAAARHKARLDAEEELKCCQLARRLVQSNPRLAFCSTRFILSLSKSLLQQRTNPDISHENWTRMYM